MDKIAYKRKKKTHKKNANFPKRENTTPLRKLRFPICPALSPLQPYCAAKGVNVKKSCRQALLEKSRRGLWGFLHGPFFAF